MQTDTHTSNSSQPSEKTPKNNAARKKAKSKAGTQRPRRPAARTELPAVPNYSETADRLFSRSKQAISSAYEWLGDTGSEVPKLARRIPLPSIPEGSLMKTMLNDKPLLIGALGLGLGAIVGGLLIANSGYSITNSKSLSAGKPKRTSTRRSAKGSKQ